MKKYIIAIKLNDLDEVICGIVDSTSQKEALDFYKSRNAYQLENHSWTVMSLCELDTNIEISDLTNEY